MRTAINLFTVREIDEPLSRVLERVADAGFDGVEFIHRLPESNTDDVVATLEETGLEAPAAHVAPFTDLDGAPDAFDAAAADYEAVGCDYLAFSIGDGYATTDAEIREAATKLDALAERVEARGFELLYHNHHWEFESLDGASRYDRLLEATDDRVGVELDVGWAAAGGADPVALIDRLGERLRVLHAKDADVDAAESVEVGDGDVDLEACVRAAAEAGVEWVVYEHDEPTDPRASISTGASFLSRFE